MRANSRRFQRISEKPVSRIASRVSPPEKHKPAAARDRKSARCAAPPALRSRCFAPASGPRPYSAPPAGPATKAESARRASLSCLESASAKTRSTASQNCVELSWSEMRSAPACGWRGQPGLKAHRIVKIGADALELRRPGRQRIRFIVARPCRAWPRPADSDHSGCAATAKNPCDCGRPVRFAACAIPPPAT